jgi:hypothetical protein
LYFIQTFATGEVDFLARYASAFLDGARFIVADAAVDLNQINDIQNRYEIEVQPVTCDLVEELQSIALAIQNLAGSDCSACGSEVDPESAPAPPIGPGEDFPTLNDFETYKCEAVNWLMDALIDIFTKLTAYNVAFWTTTTVATGGAIITAMLATTLLAGILPIIAGAVISMVLALIAGAAIDIEAIKDLLVANRSDLTCTLFSGSNASTAKSNFLTEIGDLGLNSAEVGLISLMLVFNVMNNLFELNPNIEGHPITEACTGCGASCDVFFGKFSAGQPRGSGDLTKDGAIRTLTGSKHPTLDLWYVSANVSELGNDETLFSGCTNMDGACVGTSDENWDFVPVSLSGYDNAGSAATKCVSGSHTSVWNGWPVTLGLTYQISWFEFISHDPFTIDCRFTQRP